MPPQDHSDQRAKVRWLSHARARVIRDFDPNRFEISGRIEDLSTSGVCILLSVSLEVGEYISITLENPIQRAKAKTRGEVRRVDLLEDGTYRVGVALLRRLTPREVLDHGQFQACLD